MVWSSSIYRHYPGLDAYALLGLCVRISSDMRANQFWWVCTHRASGAYAPILEGVLRRRFLGKGDPYGVVAHSSVAYSQRQRFWAPKGALLGKSIGITFEMMLDDLRQRFFVFPESKIKRIGDAFTGYCITEEALPICYL
ncbi:hypothetical protein PIB30_042486 [Stylosanthes scabra]|uniref:Uncharacterized protein n=1 Tax=Stylosanthes scabra TaxID=79078 RepID=A0ABU6YE09_9FABA|nr:hypothetical protein [Stylosanthes scabra]